MPRHSFTSVIASIRALLSSNRASSQAGLDGPLHNLLDSFDSNPDCRSILECDDLDVYERLLICSTAIENPQGSVAGRSQPALVHPEEALEALLKLALELRKPERTSLNSYQGTMTLSIS